MRLVSHGSLMAWHLRLCLMSYMQSLVLIVLSKVPNSPIHVHQPTMPKFPHQKTLPVPAMAEMLDLSPRPRGKKKAAPPFDAELAERLAERLPTPRQRRATPVRAEALCRELCRRGADEHRHHSQGCCRRRDVEEVAAVWVDHLSWQEQWRQQQRPAGSGGQVRPTTGGNWGAQTVGVQVI